MDKVIYLRVSKKELNENTQLPIILKNFNLTEKEVLVLKEKISGYKEELQEKRTELNKLINLIENQEIKEIYVYSLERIYRNIDWLLRFYFICRTNGVEIYSYLQPEINLYKDNTPINKFLKYQSVLINGFMGEQESFLISQRTKKSFIIDEKGNKISYKGNKLGSKLIKKQIGKKKIYFNEKEIENIKKKILKYNQKGLSLREIKKRLEKEEINISLSYIHKTIKDNF